MTVADEGASSGYIVGKRVNPDKKTKQAKKNKRARSSDATSTQPAMRDTTATQPADSPSKTRKNQTARKPKN